MTLDVEHLLLFYLRKFYIGSFRRQLIIAQ
jgi:hypothetical protein